jgi:hypothetical protein
LGSNSASWLLLLQKRQRRPFPEAPSLLQKLQCRGSFGTLLRFFESAEEGAFLPVQLSFQRPHFDVPSTSTGKG